MYPAHHVPRHAARPTHQPHPMRHGYPEMKIFGMGAGPAGLGDAAAYAAYQSALQALAALPTPNASGYVSDPVVAAFQSAANAAGLSPPLATDGMFGQCTYLAAQACAANEGVTLQAPGATVPNQSDGNFTCSVGAYTPPTSSTPPGTNPATCPPGQVWDGSNCVPTPPGPGGGGGGSTATASATSTIPTALIAVLGIAAVGGVAYAMSRGGAAPAGAPAKKLPAHHPAHRTAHHATHPHAHRAHENPAMGASEEWYRFQAPGVWRRYHGRPQGLRRMPQQVQFGGRLCPVYSSRSGIFLRGPDAHLNPLSTGQTAALAVGGLAAIGGVAYLLTRSPSTSTTSSTAADANGWTPVAQSAVPASVLATLQSYTTTGTPWQPWTTGPQLPPVAAGANSYGPAPTTGPDANNNVTGPYYAMGVTGTTTQFYSHP